MIVTDAIMTGLTASLLESHMSDALTEETVHREAVPLLNAFSYFISARSPFARSLEIGDRLTSVKLIKDVLTVYVPAATVRLYEVTVELVSGGCVEVFNRNSAHILTFSPKYTDDFVAALDALNTRLGKAMFLTPEAERQAELAAVAAPLAARMVGKTVTGVEGLGDIADQVGRPNGYVIHFSDNTRVELYAMPEESYGVFPTIGVVDNLEDDN